MWLFFVEIIQKDKNDFTINLICNNINQINKINQNYFINPNETIIELKKEIFVQLEKRKEIINGNRKRFKKFTFV